MRSAEFRATNGPFRTPHSAFHTSSQRRLSSGRSPLDLLGAARTGGREHFFWTAQAGCVEGAANFLHYFQVGRRKEPVHEADLFDADSVLAGDASAQVDAFVEDFVAGGQHTPDLLFVPFIEQQNRMNISVASVKNV